MSATEDKVIEWLAKDVISFFENDMRSNPEHRLRDLIYIIKKRLKPKSMTEQNAKRGAEIVTQLQMYRGFIATAPQSRFNTSPYCLCIKGVVEINTIEHKEMFNSLIKTIIMKLEQELENL